MFEYTLGKAHEDSDYTIRTIVIHYCHLVGRDYAVNLSYCWLSLLTSTTVVVYVVIAMCSKARHEAIQRSLPGVHLQDTHKSFLVEFFGVCSEKVEWSCICNWSGPVYVIGE